jgi:hypothetical protein
MASCFGSEGKGSWKMRNGFLIGMFLAMVISSGAIAQEWMEYENVGDNFAVNFPGEPEVESIIYRLGSGREVSARVYGVENEAGHFTVTVVDYDGVDADETANAIDYAADNFRQRSDVTSDEVGGYEGMDTQMLQMTNPDDSRSYVAIVHPPTNSGILRLFIAEGRAPPDGIVPGLFQQSLSLRDQDGIRVRYNRDLDGNSFRVIPSSGGEPLRSRIR